MFNPPFTVAQFFVVFADYNAAIWPLQIVAYGLGAALQFGVPEDLALPLAGAMLLITVAMDRVRERGGHPLATP